jgi:hypothetical protein
VLTFATCAVMLRRNTRPVFRMVVTVRHCSCSGQGDAESRSSEFDVVHDAARTRRTFRKPKAGFLLSAIKVHAWTPAQTTIAMGEGLSPDYLLILLAILLCS